MLENLARQESFESDMPGNAIANLSSCEAPAPAGYVQVVNLLPGRVFGLDSEKGSASQCNPENQQLKLSHDIACQIIHAAVRGRIEVRTQRSWCTNFEETSESAAYIVCVRMCRYCIGCTTMTFILKCTKKLFMECLESAGNSICSPLFLTWAGLSTTLLLHQHG